MCIPTPAMSSINVQMYNWVNPRSHIDIHIKYLFAQSQQLFSHVGTEPPLTVLLASTSESFRSVLLKTTTRKPLDASTYSQVPESGALEPSHRARIEDRRKVPAH